MKLAIVLAGGLALTGCAVEYTQTDLRPLKRADRASLREAAATEKRGVEVRLEVPTEER